MGRIPVPEARLALAAAAMHRLPGAISTARMLARMPKAEKSMPARTEPCLAQQSRRGSTCAAWLRRCLLVIAASSLSVACFLNPKTDDLPSPVFGEPGGGIDAPGGSNNDNDPDDGFMPSPPTLTPDNLGEDPATPPPDAGAEPGEPSAADAGSELADTFSSDAGSDAGWTDAE